MNPMATLTHTAGPKIITKLPGPNAQRILAGDKTYISPSYTRTYPLVAKRGRGVVIEDVDGNEFFDFAAGIAVVATGHCHPEVVSAIQKQAAELIHMSGTDFYYEQMVTLAERLSQIAPMKGPHKVYYGNSGTEAVEAAIKLARRYSREVRKQDRYELITMRGSFHGRTFGALAATAQEKFHKGFEPVLPGFRYVPFNDLAAVEQAIHEHTCAVLVEPIQGEGGVNVPSPGYLKALRELCDRHDLLLLFDEIQTGMGRTGKLFAYEQDGVIPDAMMLAKGLGAGMPIGALLATDKAAQALTPGTHGSTFGGNPLACAAALASLEALIEDDIIIPAVEQLGGHFLAGLGELKRKYSFIKDVRGKGLLIGMELDFPGKDIVTACLREGLLINCTMDTVLRFMPPLIISEEELDRLLKALDGIFGKR
jgi:predicted acetylornithine/succinylornithine family transaminase